MSKKRKTPESRSADDVKGASTDMAERKVLHAGQSATVCADAKFGGPLHVEAMAEQQQVPLLTTSPVKLDFANTSDATGPAAAELLNFKAQKVSSAMMATRRYSQSWLQAIDDVVAAARHGGCPAVAVAGSKGVGKSTLARLLVNSLLEVCPVVAFLDTDCGQSELTVPGLVSLHLLDKPLFGPPHMHMQNPSKAHFIGEFSPQGNPLHYLSCIRSLRDWYWQHSGVQHQGDLVRPPLVVNTHGWIKGLGYEVLAQVLETISPSYVMQLLTTNPNNNLPAYNWWLPDDMAGYNSPAMYQLPSVSALQQASALAVSGWAPRQPPAEQRALQWLTFARQCTGQHPLHCSWDLPAFTTAADLLAAQPPYKMPLSSVKVVFHQTNIEASKVLQAVNGAVVGLTKAASGLSNVKESVSECLGIGIVRSVDAEKEMLYILTPIPEQLLPEVTMLEVGKLDLPLALLQTSTYMSPYVSIWSLTADGTGAGAMKSRNTLLRTRLKAHA